MLSFLKSAHLAQDTGSLWYTGFLLLVVVTPRVCAWQLDTDLLLQQAHLTPHSAASPAIANALQHGCFTAQTQDQACYQVSCPRVSLNP